MDLFSPWIAFLAGGIVTGLLIYAVSDKTDWESIAGQSEIRSARHQASVQTWKRAAQAWQERALHNQQLLLDQSKVPTAPSLATVPFGGNVLGWSEHPPMLGDRWTAAELN